MTAALLRAERAQLKSCLWILTRKGLEMKYLEPLSWLSECGLLVFNPSRDKETSLKKLFSKSRAFPLKLRVLESRMAGEG